jgi:hypothetical protein
VFWTDNGYGYGYGYGYGKFCFVLLSPQAAADKPNNLLTKNEDPTT